MEIHWIVTDATGKEAGDVAQGHDIEHGSLAHYWGDVANAVAAEAAGGVHEVITNWSGRKRKAAGCKEGQGGARVARTLALERDSFKSAPALTPTRPPIR